MRGVVGFGPADAVIRLGVSFAVPGAVASKAGWVSKGGGAFSFGASGVASVGRVLSSGRLAVDLGSGALSLLNQAAGGLDQPAGGGGGGASDATEQLAKRKFLQKAKLGGE